MSLDTVRPGQRVRIQSIPDGDIRAQVIRLGLHSGAEIVCLYKTPGGPVVIGCANQELAIGRPLARRIEVETVASH